MKRRRRKHRPTPLPLMVRGEGLTHYFPGWDEAIAHLTSLGEPELAYLQLNFTKIGRLA